MIKAIYHNQVIASSNASIVVEGNHYFPVQDVNFDYLKKSSHHTTCPWKGLASYYHVKVEENQTDNAAWTYEDPKQEAKHIANYIAFWKEVRVVEE